MNFAEARLKTEVLYGVHPVLEAFRAARRTFHEVYIAKDRPSKAVLQIVQRAESFKLPILQVKPFRLEAITGARMHQGVGLKVGPYPLAPLAEMLNASTAAGDKPFMLLLDGVTDPQNLGALIRTAYCAGIHGIILPSDRSAAPTSVVSKTSSGALEHVLLSRVSNMVSTIKALKDQGLWVAGMDRNGDRSIYDFDFTGGVALVIGGEEKGIRPLVKRHCDFLISIPQSGHFNSLNASAAGAVVLYEAFRQRHVKDICDD
ncbi:MAG: 23S rRNA (guanosine(2251)-2'-O)-methyltransferase RlmB [Desulfobacterales bacterium]|nr:23S rRNA (guanosine(2251)-2'-O)-methyltransferase RlmB [Desulfobacterales bacterium]